MSMQYLVNIGLVCEIKVLLKTYYFLHFIQRLRTDLQNYDIMMNFKVLVS